MSDLQFLLTWLSNNWCLVVVLLSIIVYGAICMVAAVAWIVKNR